MSTPQFPNRTGATNSDDVCNLLQTHTATLFDLSSQTKQGHWNLRGTSFIGIHKLLDEIAETIEAHTDNVAERMTALGGYPLAHTRAAAADSVLDAPEEIVDDIAWVTFLLSQYSDYSHQLYKDIETMGDLDPASEDLLIEVVRDVDEAIYFLAAHVDDEKA